MNLLYQKIASNKTFFIGFILSLLSAYALLPAFFEYSFYPVESVDYLWKSLDSSWSLTLSYANQNNLIWGKDIAFTYGPLSFFALRTTMGINKYLLLISDIFYSTNLFFMFYLSYRRASNKILTAILILTVVLFLPGYVGGGFALLLLMILVFWLRIYIDTLKIFFLLPATAIVSLLFFVKFNTGLISFVLYFACLFYVFITYSKQRIVIVCALVTPLILIYFLAGILNVVLLDYAVSGFNLVSGYNEIMYLNTAPEYGLYFKLAYLFIFISVGYLLVQFVPQRNLIFKNLIVLFLFSVPLFVLYKQAFVRADIGHIFEFFIYSPFLLLASQEFDRQNIKSKLNVLLLPLFFISYFAFYNNTKPEILLTNLKAKFNKKEYFNGFTNTTEFSGNHLTPNTNALPSNLLSKIGQKTIDIFPWNIQLLLENKLNYLPRPILQSYSCYTKQLQNVNFDLYNSDKGPNQVLYDYASIDGRYPLFDEVKVNQVLCNNYQLTDTLYHNGRSMLLLEKKQNAKPIKFVLQKEYAIKVGSALIPEDGVYYEAYLYPTIKNKIISIFSYSPEIYLQLVTSKGALDFRISKPLLETGFFGTQIINSVADFKAMLLKQKPAEESIIKGYYIKPADDRLFSDKIRIKEYKITN